MKKIAALAAAKQIRIAPHNPSSHSELATMASVHAAAVMPNFASLEHPADHPPWRNSKPSYHFLVAYVN